MENERMDMHRAPTQMTLEAAFAYIKKHKLDIEDIVHAHDDQTEKWNLSNCEIIEIVDADSLKIDDSIQDWDPTTIEELIAWGEL
jgi:hypothetical protein